MFVLLAMTACGSTNFHAVPSQPVGAVPAARWSPAMAFDATRGEVILFGGQTLNTFFSDTWAWNGHAWHRLTPHHAPSPRSSAEIAYDPAHRELVLFGGVGENGADPTDTWLWDGTDWSRGASPLEPPGTWSQGMTFFPRTGSVVLYHGGNPFSSSPSGLFSWDGRRWTQLAAAGGPPPGQQQTALSVDPVRGVLVAITDDVGSANVQQWEFDGRFWLHASVATPPQRDMVQTVADQAHRTIVLFGGLGKNDTWTWDGFVWARQFPLQSPPVRSTTGPMPGMAYDAARGEVVVFGGVGDGPVLNDTWLWDGAGWRQAA